MSKINDTVLTPNERADLLNMINETLEKKSIPLIAYGYEDDGFFFSVIFGRPLGYEKKG